MRSQYED